MGLTARDFFERLPTLVDPAKTAGVRSSYRFEIDGAGVWTIELDDGAVRVHEGARDAVCAIVAPEDVFMRIVTGQQNPVASFMTGRLKVKGDIGAAMRLQQIF